MVVPETLLEQTNDIRTRVAPQTRVSVTDLARSTAWRKSLKKDKVMEVIDRGNQVGWLLSSEGMQAMLDTMDYFETELERVQVAYICALRNRQDDWASGVELSASALTYLDNNYDDIRAIFDVH